MNDSTIALVKSVGICLIIIGLTGIASNVGYRRGKLDTEIKWQNILAEKNIIVLDVSTTHTTNYHGDFKWVR